MGRRPKTIKHDLAFSVRLARKILQEARWSATSVPVIAFVKEPINPSLLTALDEAAEALDAFFVHSCGKSLNEARQRRLSPERRSQIAKNAIERRWAKERTRGKRERTT